MQLGSFIDMQKQVAYLKAGYINMQLFFHAKSKLHKILLWWLKLGISAEEKKNQNKNKKTIQKGVLICHKFSDINLVRLFICLFSISNVMYNNLHALVMWSDLKDTNRYVVHCTVFNKMVWCSSPTAYCIFFPQKWLTMGTRNWL